MFEPEVLRRALIAAPIILLALTVHEFFHAWAALRFGDTTARDLGRLTLNPLAHLDLLGALCFIASGFRFGWAKPVPVNLYNVRDARKADLWISAAGPLSNIGQALIFGVLLRVWMLGLIDVPQRFAEPITLLLYFGVTINLGLAFFNMIPLFPLDGSHILRNLLPERYSNFFESLDAIAPFLLLGLVFLGGVWLIIGPFVRLFAFLFAGIPLA